MTHFLKKPPVVLLQKRLGFNQSNLAKVNRIYQATTNVLDSFSNLSQTILQASELIAAYTGKIGNALKKGGVILENAYAWMNPQPKFNRVTEILEGLQNGASTIQMVTQAPFIRHCKRYNRLNNSFN